jgi:hypothetical protein
MIQDGKKGERGFPAPTDKFAAQAGKIPCAAGHEIWELARNALEMLRELRRGSAKMVGNL